MKKEEILANCIAEIRSGKSTVADCVKRYPELGKERASLLEIAASLDDLRVPPGNRLEALKGDRAGQHSIRINDQFRVCFRWRGDSAFDVEITDYH